MSSLEKIPRSGGTAYRIRYHLNGRYYTEYLPLNTPVTNAKAVQAEFDRRLALHKLGTLLDPGRMVWPSGFFC
jgi:hypothetical protein